MEGLRKMDKLSLIGVTPMEYSYFVEGKIMTSGNDRLIENVLGLVGESGEIAEKLKKAIRDKHPLNRYDILKELGDVLFYVTSIANYHDSSLADVLEINMRKLKDREERGVLSGSGDNR
tara:strand:- start:2102 stop:2458 length:357 start_codon:yes stop_codon:yes gene_type:complete